MDRKARTALGPEPASRKRRCGFLWLLSSSVVWSGSIELLFFSHSQLKIRNGKVKIHCFNKYPVLLTTRRGRGAGCQPSDSRCWRCLIPTWGSEQQAPADMCTSSELPSRSCPVATPAVQSFCISVPSPLPWNRSNWQNRNVTKDPCDMSHINYLYRTGC